MSRTITLLGLILGLVGCGGDLRNTPVLPPAPPIVGNPPPSARSLALAGYYSRAQEHLLERGLLRTDAGGSDAPFSEETLVTNFVRIALFDEYRQKNGRFVPQETASHLRRWNKPVRMQIIFGASISEERRISDTAEVRAYAERLSRATRHPISLVPSNGNFFILVMNADELANTGPIISSLVPGAGSTVKNEIARLPRFTFCAVYAFSEGRGRIYSSAISVIRAEHPDLLRLSCYHEELAQGLGLANDSLKARPSIFNDDEEFALLTRHDELLLRILYDPRMRPGMTPATATRQVEIIARELLGGTS